MRRSAGEWKLAGMGPIVVGYERSKRSLDALALGVTLAHARGTRLIAVYVDPDDQPFATIDRAEQALARADVARLKERAQPLLESLGGRATFHSLADVSAPRALHDFARDERASLLVVGSTSAGPIRRVAVGSTAARLFVDAPCPVAIAPRGFAERQPGTLATVGVALDGKADSAGALTQAAMIATDAGAVLRAVTVSPRWGRARRRVTALESEVDVLSERRGGAVERVRLRGRPGRALAKASDGMDLLVVGCREEGAIQHPGSRSVSRQLVPASASPLLVVPEGLAR